MPPIENDTQIISMRISCTLQSFPWVKEHFPLWRAEGKRRSKISSTSFSNCGGGNLGDVVGISGFTL